MNTLDAKKIALRAVRRMFWPVVGSIVIHKNTAGPTYTFYQAVKRTPRTVTLRMIDEDINIIHMDDGSMACKRKPLPNEFVDIEKPVRLVLRQDGGIGPRQPWSMIWRVWDGRPVLQAAIPRD